MHRGRPVISRRTSNLWVGLVALILVLSVASCEAEEGEQEVASQAQTVKAENAEVGKTIEGQGWKVTLLDAPEQMKMVGGNVGADPMGIEKYLPGFSIDRRHLTDDDITAQGIYVIVSVEITNTSDEPQMVTRGVLQVVDSEAQEYGAARNLQHLVIVWTNEQWMDDAHLIVPSVPDPGVVREGPLVYDVPEDATGLKLVIAGTDATIDLGF